MSKHTCERCERKNLDRYNYCLIKLTTSSQPGKTSDKPFLVACLECAQNTKSGIAVFRWPSIFTTDVNSIDESLALKQANGWVKYADMKAAMRSPHKCPPTN